MEQKTKLVFTNEVWKKMMWLTKNIDTEIGALGTVEFDEETNGARYFIITKLFFPDQEVTSSSVHIEADGYGDIIKEATIEELEIMQFYWHRHPSSANHSHVDEIETFGTFMDSGSKRKFFIFMQTAQKSNGEIDIEARIEFNYPVKMTIYNENISVMHEASPEDNVLAEECKKIIESKVKEKKYSSLQTFYKSFNRQLGNKNKSLSHNICDTTVIELQDMFPSCSNELTYIDNDIIYSYYTDDEEKVSISCKDGAFIVSAGKQFNELMEKEFANALSDLAINNRHYTITDSGIFRVYKIQPKTKKYTELKESLFKLFIEYNKNLFYSMLNGDIKEKDNNVYTLEDNEISKNVLTSLESIFNIEWDKDVGIVKENENVIGRIYDNVGLENTTFIGKDLIDNVKTFIYGYWQQDDIYLGY